jgi:hypothetical protein
LEFRNSRLARTAAAGAVSMLVAATGVVLATASPAQAEARCNGGRPKSTAGKFTNRTDQTMMAKGDKYVGKVNGKDTYKTVEVAISRNGGTSVEAGLCDADFFKTYWDWYYINKIVDGDSWAKIGAFSWACWNTPGDSFHIACGGA